MHVLFVCTGNTCRSPMAAFLLREKVRERNLNIEVDSAGIYAGDGQAMSTNAQSALKRKGSNLDPATHRSKPITADLVHQADYIFTMTHGHTYELLLRFPEAAKKVWELARFVHEDSDSDSKSSVHYDIVDPFGGSDEQYAACLNVLDEMVTKLLDKLVSGGTGDTSVSD